jgi:uncharacterized phiE125 gp8 family phage protein
MTTAIRRVVAPASLPVTLSEAKSHCRVDYSDDDAFISALLDAAVSHIDAEGELGRAMITQTWAQWEMQSPGWPRLKMGPFQALVSVEYYDADGALQTATLADFETRLDRDFVIVKPKEDREWPRADTRADAIKITYTAGFGDAASDVPRNIRHAILMLVAHWYENREAVAEARMAPVPMAVEALLNNERVGWYG